MLQSLLGEALVLFLEASWVLPDGPRSESGGPGERKGSPGAPKEIPNDGQELSGRTENASKRGFAKVLATGLRIRSENRRKTKTKKRETKAIHPNVASTGESLVANWYRLGSVLAPF